MHKILDNIPLLTQFIFSALFLLLLCWKLIIYKKYKYRYNLESFSEVLYFSKYRIINSRSDNSRRFKCIQNRISVFLLVCLVTDIILFLLLTPEVFN